MLNNLARLMLRAAAYANQNPLYLVLPGSIGPSGFRDVPEYQMKNNSKQSLYYLQDMPGKLNCKQNHLSRRVTLWNKSVKA